MYTAFACSKCNIKSKLIFPFTPENVCSLCKFNYLCCKTDAKRIYKLKDSDLKPLNFYNSAHFIYGNLITYYSKKDIIQLQKYGS